MQLPEAERIDPATLPNPWELDAATRTRRPAWPFPALGHHTSDARGPPAPGLGAYGAGLLDYDPDYSLVDRRVLGVMDFARLLRRCVCVWGGGEAGGGGLRMPPAGSAWNSVAVQASICMTVHACTARCGVWDGLVLRQAGQVAARCSVAATCAHGRLWLCRWGDSEKARRAAAREPAVGDYDLSVAWAYLTKHAPQVRQARTGE